MGEKDQKISELDEKLAAANLTMTDTLEKFKTEMLKTVTEQDCKNGAAIEQLKTELKVFYEDKITKQEEEIAEQREEIEEQGEKVTALEEKMETLNDIIKEQEEKIAWNSWGEVVFAQTGSIC